MVCDYHVGKFVGKLQVHVQTDVAVLLVWGYVVSMSFIPLITLEMANLPVVGPEFLIFVPSAVAYTAPPYSQFFVKERSTACSKRRRNSLSSALSELKRSWSVMLATVRTPAMMGRDGAEEMKAAGGRKTHDLL
jgi:branched-subunit amino acid transport protein